MTPSTDTNSTATNFLINRPPLFGPFISLTSVSAIFSAGDALPVRLQAVGQLLRTGEGDEVAAGHLVGSDAQTFLYDPALKFHREEAIVAALQKPRRYLGPLR